MTEDPHALAAKLTTALEREQQEERRELEEELRRQQATDQRLADELANRGDPGPGS